MLTNIRLSRRIKRGYLHKPGRYWTLFVLCSVAAHIMVLASMSDAAMSFIRNLKSTGLPNQPIYVGLLYQNGVSARVPVRAAGPGAVSGARAAMPGREESTHGGPQPGHKPVALGAFNGTLGPSDRAVAQAAAPDKGLDIGNIWGSSGLEGIHADMPQGAGMPAGPDLEGPEVAGAEEHGGGVVVIKGTEKTTVAPDEVKPVPAAAARPPLPDGNTAAAKAHPFSSQNGPAPVALARIVEVAPSKTVDIARPAAAAVEKPPIPAEVIAHLKAAEAITAGSVSAAVLEKPEIRITRPAGGDTDQPRASVEGAVSGAGITEVLITLGTRKMELLVRNGSFKTTVMLDEGRNVITASVADAGGRTAHDSVVVSYVSSRPAPIISFTTPAKNAIIDALKGSRVTMAGTVEGGGIESVRVYLNGSTYEAKVEGGRFSLTAALEKEQNVLYAEAADASGKISKSEVVRFTAVNLSPKDFTVSAKYAGTGASFRLACRWKAHPLGGEGANGVPGPRFDTLDNAAGGMASVGKAVPGIYTVGVEYDTGSAGECEAVFEVSLYGYDPGLKKVRRVGPVKLRGKGYKPVVRVLMPEWVFWEDDAWFSGIVESGQGTVKYREPEGIVWREEE